VRFHCSLPEVELGRLFQFFLRTVIGCCIDAFHLAFLSLFFLAVSVPCVLFSFLSRVFRFCYIVFCFLLLCLLFFFSVTSPRNMSLACWPKETTTGMQELAQRLQGAKSITFARSNWVLWRGCGRCETFRPIWRTRPTTWRFCLAFAWERKSRRPSKAHGPSILVLAHVAGPKIYNSGWCGKFSIAQG